MRLWPRKQSERGAQALAATAAGAVGEGEEGLEETRGAWGGDEGSGETWAPRLTIPTPGPRVPF
jgi:hypothetical protein